MQHIIFQESNDYKIAILIKTASFKKTELDSNYVQPLVQRGIKQANIIAFDLEYNSVGKITVSFATDYLNQLLPCLHSLSIEYLLVSDSIYFKKLTGVKKVDVHYGYVLPCKMKGYEHMKIVLCTNYSALFFNPDLQAKLDLSLNTLSNSIQGINFTIGSNIIHNAYYPTTDEAIKRELYKLSKHPEITCDVETFSLRFWETGIGTIAFSWDKHNGVAFPIQAAPNNSEGLYCISNKDDYRWPQQLLRHFFQNYKGKLVFHNANFDMKIIINALWMNDLLDQQGMLTGIEVMTRNFDDTKIIAYLATNSCAGNDLKLKNLAHEFAGNYAVDDINDITKIEINKLLEYNLVDCLSTAYVKEKYYPKMIEDNQLDIYKNIMLPSVKILLQIELTGMPLNISKVHVAKRTLETNMNVSYKEIFASPIIQAFVTQMRKEAWVEKNLLLKVKVKPIEDFDDIVFNPGSNKQVAHLLYEYLDYPVLDLTDSKQPSTKGKTIKKLMLIAKSVEHKRLFELLIKLADASIILNTFVKSFLNNSVLKKDGVYYLHGNFNIGGTVSGRLSSSGPNMQNLPSTGSVYAKLIKECFEAPEGWLFVGADFASLEDRISALTTKDPNKLKVYEDGFDGHCLRAFSYFGEAMPDILNTVKSINSIAKLYPDLRQESKAPTFLLTYGGTYHGLISNVGLTKDRAMLIEHKYHDLYEASDNWVKDRIKKAAQEGYAIVAFGLCVRTPVLKQTILNTKATPFAATSEARTVGNAFGQSYGLLNNRAGIEFQERTLSSNYAMDIRPMAHIHDSQYFMIRNTVEVMEWFNINLIECMEWQELPEIQHDVVKLGGNVEVFYPNWASKYELPNNATRSQILEICKR